MALTVLEAAPFSDDTFLGSLTAAAADAGGYSGGVGGGHGGCGGGGRAVDATREADDRVKEAKASLAVADGAGPRRPLSMTAAAGKWTG